MDYLEKEKQEYNNSSIDWAVVNNMLKLEWKKGFEAGAKAFAEKHKQFIMMFSDN